MKLIPIPKNEYENYRIRLMFDCYKWDPQFSDSNTIAPYVLVLTKQECDELIQYTEALDKETRDAEQFLNQNQKYVRALSIPRKIRNEIANMREYNPEQNIRLTRYDFHPTVDGTWAVSEVNSDVPGGFAEGSFMPQAAMEAFAGDLKCDFINFGECFISAVERKVKKGGKIMLVHCTAYSDDRQAMQFLGDCLVKRGYSVMYGAADHLRFENGEALSILDDNKGEIDAIIRFTPLEWLVKMRPKRWQGYFDTKAVSCNHPVAIYAQTKRFPFVFDLLEANGLSVDTWRKLLPETLEVKAAKGKKGYIYKPVYGRVGEKISIKEACSKEEYLTIMKDVKRHPRKYLAQKKFISKPLKGENGKQLHVCVGSYAVDGKHAGFYARLSNTPRIDSAAADIPVVIECTGNMNDGKTMNVKARENGLRVPENITTKEKEAYRIWAPAGERWVDWVRPVPFVGIEGNTSKYVHFGSGEEVVDCSAKEYENSAVIVDLPGAESVEKGIALAKCGYRPIPIYNGTSEQQGARATVDNRSVGEALLTYADVLKDIQIPKEALPAFLTDTNRLNRHKMDASVFDNSWDVFPQDIPSPEYFRKNRIFRIIILGEGISRDLKRILYPYQKKKIQIYYTDGYGTPKRIRLSKPSRKAEE